MGCEQMTTTPMNRIYTIQYDLLRPGQNYSKLIEAIKGLSLTWAKPLESCFVIVSTLSAAQIRDSLKSHLDANDKLLVMQAGPDWASLNLPIEVSDWLKRYVS
jgi:hypothetical protein